MDAECCCRCCCCSVCCYADAVAAAVLLLPAAVRHRVPDDKIYCWFIESYPSVFIDFFLMYPLAVLSRLRPRFAHILGNYGIRACSEPRRASVRRGESHLVLLYDFPPVFFCKLSFPQQPYDLQYIRNKPYGKRHTSPTKPVT